MSDARHLPVLCAETLELLAPARGGLYLDCTVGLGGHAEALLESAPTARLVGLDRDPAALALAAQRLAPFGSRVELLCGRFSELRELLGAERLGSFTGVLADLGVSSMQLDETARGFSFRRDGPLDMRMGEGELTAADVVNDYEEDDLAKIIGEYGEEREARRVARAIVATRTRSPLGTTSDLARAIASAKRRHREREGRVDPATRTFQAIRMEVNGELAELGALLNEFVDILDRDGRLVVISYHSLEDRLVKHRLRDLATGETEPATGRRRAETRLVELLTKKPVRPTAVEVAANPRARSARLRAARRI